MVFSQTAVSSHYNMTFRNMTLLFLLTFVSFYTNGQGRVDTDQILNKTWWTVTKIDSESILKNWIKMNNNEVIAFYLKKDIICKIVKLTKQSHGTKMTAYYYLNKTPIFISLKKNNFSFSTDQILKAISSFKEKIDSTKISIKPPYQSWYEASYYFNNDKVKYVNIWTSKGIRVNEKSDKEEGLKFFNEGEYLLRRKK